MPRRTIYYVVLTTLIWGVLAGNKQQIRDIFRNNTTRNEFSNLLKSLIRLNEQRVNVLQKLTRLEDYGVLSEVLRTGNKRTRNGKQKDLLLVLLTKNQSDPRRRNTGMQVKDSIPSLNNSKNIVQRPKLRAKSYTQKDHLIKQGYVRYNPLKNDNFQLVFGDNKKPMKKNSFEIDHRTHILTTIAPNDSVENVYRNSKPLNMLKIELINTHVYNKESQENVEEIYDSNYPKIKDDKKTFRKEPQDRFKIISDGRNKHLNSSRETLDIDDFSEKYRPIASVNDQDKQYSKINISTENDTNIKYLQNHRGIFNEDDQRHIKSKVNEDTSNKNYNSIQYPPSTVNRSNENDHGNKYPNIARNNSNKNFHDSKYSQMTTNSLNENDHDKKYPKTTTIGISNKNVNGSEHPTITRDNSNASYHGNKKPILATTMSDDKNHIRKHYITAKEIYDEEVYDNYANMMMEPYGKVKPHANSHKDNQENTHRDPKSNPIILFGPSRSRPVARNNIIRCLNKKALRLCNKSCTSAYKNTCRKLKCSSRSKKKLHAECKISCKKTFKTRGHSGSDSGSDSDEDSDSYEDRS